MLIKVSVIVPIYDTEKYLERCLDSLLCQSFHNFEIICVDDCSPDNCSDIIEAYSRRDPRIVSIRHTKNIGLGGARNTGIRAARGDYIASVDSDDYVLPNMLETVYGHTNSGKYDIVVFGYDRVDEHGVVRSTEAFKPQLLSNYNAEIDIFGLTNPGFGNKLWRRSLFIENNMFFPDRLYYEDLALTPRIFAVSKTIKLIPDIFYKYVFRDSSITRSYGPKQLLDYFKVFELLYIFVEERGLVDRYQKEFVACVNRNLEFHSKNVANSSMSDQETLLYLRQLLIYKIAFLESHMLLKKFGREEHIAFIEHATSVMDLRPS